MATIEIDGKPYQVDNGKMIIEVTDELGIHIPRFCYHKKLSVAANCRMCLVQIENSRKPVPACATPITEGMKIQTQSEETLRSQKAVMEFLLINHPLDCPICDQGGECELQDVSMGFGSGESAYQEAKRVVNDEDLGALISTDMTRCIQCTRCVRFGEEIAGVRELGATGRGEDMQIGTYVQHAMTSEVSGNIIDLCPVGALTSKPYRFTARAWELTQHSGVAPHDCLGSTVHAHVRGQAVMRVVPKEQEQVNETWLSDRDRFSYLGLSHPQRAQFPRIKKAGKWQTVDWQTALQFAATSIGDCITKYGSEQFAAFASSSSTVEEMYLLQRWMRAMGVNNVDHRLQQMDVRDQTHAGMVPSSTLAYADLDKQSNIVLIGTHLHRELPLAGVRVRKASLLGATVFAINPVDYDFPFTVSDKMIIAPQQMVASVGKVLLALVKDKSELPAEVQTWLKGVKPDDVAKHMAKALQQDNAVIVTGALLENHPDASILRTLIHYIQSFSAAKSLRFTVGSNANGGWLAGMVPHRTACGEGVSQPGLAAKDSIEQGLKGYCLLGVDPSYDFAHTGLARQAMLGAECVVALTAFDDPSLEEVANVILPIGVFTETSGTYINIDGLWQTVSGCSKLAGEARPAWKVLRVLANLMKCERFDYESSEQVLNELKSKLQSSAEIAYQPFLQATPFMSSSGLMRVGGWPLYGIDGLVRHAEALQHCGSVDKASVRMHPETAQRYKVTEIVTISQGVIAVTLPLEYDEKVAKDTVCVLNGLSETMDLGYPFAEIEVMV
ncbi:MAG: NADH-quinone oxidoreductase subunit NuoG [Gammaproteobacteria bacterium]|nr:NADH-quinone oxidoreductase subunit NuoG [Gammaproteobacteria bacterium]